MERVFISYAGDDREFANKIVADLTERLPGVEIVYDLLLPAGGSFADTLLAEIRKAGVVLAILSPSYVASPWKEQELNAAIERNLNGETRLIPVLYHPCDPKGFVRRLVPVDFTGNYESALTELVWGITGERPATAAGAAPGTPATQIEDLEQQRKSVTGAVESFAARPASESVQTPAPTANPNCRFIIMPFGDKDLNDIFEQIIRPTVIECKLHGVRGDDVFGSNSIVQDIMKSIRDSRIVIADLTGRNANVFYEVGLCHAWGKAVLLLSQSIDDVPFDLRHLRILKYENTFVGGKTLREKLKQNLEEMLKPTAPALA
jgi:hypothetical protein